MRRIGAKAAALVVAAMVVLAATACDPVLHPTFREVEPYVAPFGGPVGFRLLSADGGTVVVRATGPGATVPGAGTWRVDRATGQADELPNGEPLAINRDGRRVLLRGSNPWTEPYLLWNDGTVITPRATAALSDDLEWGVYYDTNLYQYVRWNIDSGEITPLEDAFPRPPDTPDLTGSGAHIADGGGTVWFQMIGPGGCRTRFLHVDLGVVHDVDPCLDDMFTLVAANGSAYVRFLDPVSLSEYFPQAGGPTRLELVSTITGDVLASTRVASSFGFFDAVVVADSGWNLWAVENDYTGPYPSPCGGAREPLCVRSLNSVTAVSASPNGEQRFPADDGLARGAWDQPMRMSIDSGGRFLVYGAAGTSGSVHVLDRVTGTDEALVGGGGFFKGVPAISDGGAVVAFGELSTDNGWPNIWSGWFEHLSN